MCFLPGGGLPPAEMLMRLGLGRTFEQLKLIEMWFGMVINCNSKELFDRILIINK